MNKDFCELVGLMAAYLSQHPEGNARLRAFLEGTTERLWDTKDLMLYTGWGKTHVCELCSTGRLPYIPGKPNKFIPKEVKKALEDLQTGGVYGRRKTKLKTRR
jgi:hypothetical protein